MPKINGYSRDNLTSTTGIVDLHISWLNQPCLTTSDVLFNSITTTGNATINGNTVITGDLTVNGNAAIISTNISEFQDNLIVINSEETGTGVTPNIAGIEIERGVLTNYQSVFQESTGLFKIGQIGSLQAVATREDSPLVNGVMVYNSTLGRLDSVNDIVIPITFSNGTNSTSSTTGTVKITNGGGLGVTGDIYSDSKHYFKGTGYSTYISSNVSNNLLLNSGNNTLFQQSAGSLITIPTDVLLAFNDFTKNINTNGTLLNVNNTTGNINFTTASSGSLLIPVNTYLEWNSTNRLRYNGTNITLDASSLFLINSKVSISDTTDSTDSSTGGAFTSLGGGSIKKRMYIGDSLILSDVPAVTTQVSGQGINFRSLNRTLTTASTINTDFNSFEGGVINSSGVISSSSTLYISSAPTVTGGGSITNPYALLVGSGNTKLNGTLQVIDFTPADTIATGAINTTGGISSSLLTDSTSSTVGNSLTIGGGAAISKTLRVGKGIDIGDTSITTTQIAGQGVNFRSRNRTLNTSSTNDTAANTFEGFAINTSSNIANAATVYISGAPTISGGGILTNSYALHVASGSTKFDGGIYLADTTATTSSTIGAIVTEGGIASNNSTDAISENSGGSGTFNGGFAIKKKLFTGGEITSNKGTGSHYRLYSGGLSRFTLDLNNTESGANSGSDFIIERYSDLGVALADSLTIKRDTGNVIVGSSTSSTSNTTGALQLTGGIAINNSTNATSTTNGGTFTSSGGGAFLKDLYVGGGSYITGAFDVNGATTLDQTTIDTTDGLLTVSGTNGISAIVGDTSVLRTTSGSLTLDSFAGTLILNGASGMTLDSASGISIDAGNTSNFSCSTGVMTIAGVGLNVAGGSGEIDITTTGLIDINAGTNGMTLDTTDTTNGITIGTQYSGVPINIGNANSIVTVGDSLVVNGDFTVLGTTTTIESSITTIVDNALVVNAGPTASSDGGYLIRKYQTPNNAGTGDVVNILHKETSTFQSGSSTPGTLVLNSSANVADDYYNGWWIKITSGAGNLQTRRIKDYIGSSRTVTLYVTADNVDGFVDGLNLTTAPSSGDSYKLYDGSYVGIYHDSINNEIRFANVPFDISSGLFNDPSSYLNIHVNDVILDGLLTLATALVNGPFTIDTTDPSAFLVRKNGDTGHVFKVDSTNSDFYFTKPVNTGDVTLYFQQYDSVAATQTYSKINSVLQNNVAGNLRADLTFDVQKDTSGLVTFLTLSGNTGYTDFSTDIDAVRVLNTTASTSTTNGSMRLSGGLSISNATEATDADNGGSATLGGGAAIKKKLYVGGQIFGTSSNNIGTTDNSIGGTEGSLNVNGDITLYNGTKNTISFSTNGSASPSFTNRSVGTKLNLLPNVSGSTVDSAIGIESNAMWYSAGDSSYQHKFYLGTSEYIRIDSNGITTRQAGTGIHFYNGSNTANIYESSNIIRLSPSTSIITEGFEFRNSGDSSTRIRINSDGKLALGISGYSGTPSSSGGFLSVNSVIFTDSATSASGTASIMSFNSILQPTLAATNTSVTTTDSINTYISGAPIKGTNMSVTNAYGLYIAQGSSISSSGTVTNASSLYIQGAPTGTSITDAYALFVDSGASRLDGQVIITDSSQVGTTDNSISGTEGALNINGDITMYNGTKNTIVYSAVGSSAPSLTNRSVGSKIVLNPVVDASNVDHAIGIESNATWYSVPSTTTSHKFYLGTSNRFTIDNTGILLNSSGSNTATILRLNTTDGSDDRGIIIKGGGNGDYTRGAQLELYGNEYTTGNAQLSAGDSGQIILNTGNGTARMTILTTGEVILTSSTDTTGTGTGALRINGGTQIDKSLFVGTDSGSILALDFNQRYDISGNASGNLLYQSKTSGVVFRQRNFTLDGDNTDDNITEIYGLGTPSSLTNTEYLRIGYESSATSYVFKTQKTGTGTARELNIETGTNTGQIKLLTTGQVSFSSTEATNTSSNGAIRTPGGISSSNTTNATSSTNGGGLTLAGGLAAAKDAYIGQDLYVTGNISQATTSPTITTSNNTNVTGAIVSTKNLTKNGTIRDLRVTFRVSPTTAGLLTSFEFTIPDAVSNWVNVYDIVVASNGYNNDADPLDVNNLIGYAVTGTTRGKVKFTANGTDTHTIQLTLRYSV